MSLTLGMTGMDPATETALKAAFVDANARLGSRWKLLGEGEAEHVMVDMDSMYGPMSWLRLHAAGKKVVGLTTAPRAQTDFRLGRPFDSDGFAELLREVAAAQGIELGPAAAPVTRSQPQPAPAKPEPPAGPEVAEAGTMPPPVQPPSPPPPPSPEPVPETEPLPGAQATSAAQPPAAVVPRELTLADWLVPGILTRRVRYRRDSGPTLLLDPGQRTYHGPATLKPFAAYFDGPIAPDAFEPLDAATWERESTAAGPAHPLLRLQWLGGLVAGKGALLPGLDPEGRYRLQKWPQTEREYPRHFRIATAMMKGPATMAEIAEASGMSAADVADFINANLATGYAEHVPDAPPEPAEPSKPGGLLGRLRGGR